MRYCFGETKSVAEFSANDSANDFHGRLLFRDSFPPEISGGIFKGLHGYETLPAAQRGAYSGDCIIVRCIIPPNTPFIRGKKGEIVALALTIGKAVYGQEFLVRQFNGE